MWSFGNDFARNVLIFGNDKKPSSYTDNRKNNFLVLVKDLLMILKAAEKKLSINFSQVKTKFCLSLHYHDNSYLFVNGKEICKFKADNKNVNFPIQCCITIGLI